MTVGRWSATSDASVYSHICPSSLSLSPSLPRSVSLSLSLSLSLTLSHSISLYLSHSLSLYLSRSLYLPPSLPPSLSLSRSLSLYIYLSPSLSLSVLYACVCVCACVCARMCVCVVRTSLPRCLCKTGACPPTLCLLLSSYEPYVMYFSHFVLGFLCFFSRQPFFALLSSRKHRGE